MKVLKDDRFLVSVKEGDTLMVMGDRARGIALLKTDLFYELMGGVFHDGDQDQPSEKRV